MHALLRHLSYCSYACNDAQAAAFRLVCYGRIDATSHPQISHQHAAEAAEAEIDAHLCARQNVDHVLHAY